ncbi:AAA family ATPase [Sulfuricurvum sp.]|uniref:AAA family ATPase n=1 Tax=Sulfuricurvum sp. TaxID=2025608 RepID=UPI003C4DF68D
MIIAYVSTIEKECFTRLREFFDDVVNLNRIDEFISFYASHRNRDIVLIYRVESMTELEMLHQINFSNNIYIIVIGPDDINLSLRAGKMGVDKYISRSDVNPEAIKQMVAHSQSVIKERRGKSNIAVFTGISGGVGTTTITMNLAAMVAAKHPEKNVLFLDFSYTKSVSNLFFDAFQPQKNIIDIASLARLDLEDLFANGLMKYDKNLFFIPGIQRHTDRETLEKAENIQRFLAFITFAKQFFDLILIDVGMFEDVELEIDIQEIADQIFVVTELNIPAMSILKTYIDIIDKSGWYSKTHILVNREDSFGTVTQDEATMILSKDSRHKFEVDFTLPNDAKHLRPCWNEAMLVCEEFPESNFVKRLEMMIDRYFFTTSMEQVTETKKPLNPLWTKVKQWL